MLIYGPQIEKRIQEFYSRYHSFYLFSAYATKNAIKNIGITEKLKALIVRWDTIDLLLGQCDLTLYQYCVDNNITLLRNENIHLKCFWNLRNDAIIGSSNYTFRGLNTGNHFNYEINTEVRLDIDDILYLNKLYDEAHIVDYNFVKRIESFVIQKDKLEIMFENKLRLENEIKEQRKFERFKINQLPMTETPELFLSIYLNNDWKHPEAKYVLHDMVSYGIKDRNLNESEIKERLKKGFNEHSFILAFKEAVKNEPNKSMRFGAVRRWFADNTIDVPCPKAYELTNTTRRMYHWICELDISFKWNIPGENSQVIYII